MAKQLKTGHDFAAESHLHGGKVSTWDKGTNNYYQVKTPDGKNSIVFPCNTLSKGTQFNLLVALAKFGLLCFFLGIPALWITTELVVAGVIK
jgi:hypothetical protein